MQRVDVEEVVDHDSLLLVVVPVATSTSSQPISAAATATAPPSSPHVRGWNAARGCASTMHTTRDS
jgi:hypothetical protein